MADAIVVEAGACTNAVLEGDVAKNTHPNAGGRGVANAHLADGEDATAFSDAVINKVAANLYGFVELLFTHSRFVEEVLGASGYLAVNDTINFGQIIVDTNIDDTKFEAMLATEHIDTASTTSEINHLLPSDLTRRYADSLAFNAVIAT